MYAGGDVILEQKRFLKILQSGAKRIGDIRKNKL
ncbi:hypothetical protein SRABI84_03821 [Peribacillus simplex]|nr:hypothetical protein SRABI84_03821 [Peribacillus simplex]